MPRPRSDIAPRILHAARSRFLLEGVDGASLRGIARDASTNIGMIYYYFPTKDDLFLAVVEQAYVGLLKDLGEALDPSFLVRERIERAFERLGRLSPEEFMVVRMVIREALISSARFQRIVERFSRGHLPLLARTLAEGVEQGIIIDRYPLPVLVAACASLGAVPSLLLNLLRAHAPALAAAVWPSSSVHHALVDILFNGIGTTAEGPASLDPTEDPTSLDPTGIPTVVAPSGASHPPSEERGAASDIGALHEVARPQAKSRTKSR